MNQVEYTFRLAQFEGPLDLLLHLVEKAKVEISDIFISEITEQYLAYMSEIDELDMDRASEFLTMAATLLLIKSRKLLPAVQSEEEEDPEAALMLQIEEYRLFKKAALHFKELEEQAAAVFYKLPEEYPLPPPDITLKEADLDKLRQAFDRVLERYARKHAAVPGKVRRIYRDRFTAKERMAYIRRMLMARGRFDFMELFSPRPSRMEIVCTFSALLDMLVAREITIMQEKAFGRIFVERAEAAETAELE